MSKSWSLYSLWFPAKIVKFSRTRRKRNSLNFLKPRKNSFTLLVLESEFLPKAHSYNDMTKLKLKSMNYHLRTEKYSTNFSNYMRLSASKNKTFRARPKTKRKQNKMKEIARLKKPVRKRKSNWLSLHANKRKLIWDRSMKKKNKEESRKRWG